MSMNYPVIIDSVKWLYLDEEAKLFSFLSMASDLNLPGFSSVFKWWSLISKSIERHQTDQLKSPFQPIIKHATP